MPDRAIWPPQCKIKPSHFKVASGASYLKSAIETDVPENKTRILGQGEKVILEAIQQNGQDKNPAAWYYLGRIYLQQGNLYPADTALTKAGAAGAGLRQGHRRLPPERLGRAGEGGHQIRGGQERRLRARDVPAGGRHLPRLADRVLSDRRDPERQGPARQRGRTTSARPPPCRCSTDTTDIKVRNRSAFNQGALLLNGKKYDQAAVVFEQYLKWVADGQRGQARPGRRRIVAAARSSRRRRWRRSSSPPVARRGAAERRRIAGPDVGGRERLQRQEVRRCRGGVREGGGRRAVQSRRALQPQQHLSRHEGRPQAGGDRGQAGGHRAAERDRAQAPGRGLQAERQGGRCGEDRRAGAGASGRREGIGLQRDGQRGDPDPDRHRPRGADGRRARPFPPRRCRSWSSSWAAPARSWRTQDAQVPALAAGASQEIKVAGQGAGIAAWRYKRK